MGTVQLDQSCFSESLCQWIWRAGVSGHLLKGSCCLCQPWRDSLIQPSVPITCSPWRCQSSNSGIDHCLCVWKSLSCDHCFAFDLLIVFLFHWAPVNILLLLWSFDLLVIHLPLLCSFWENLSSCLSWLLQFPRACSLLLPYESIGLTFWTSRGHSQVLCPCRPCASFGPYLCPELALLLSAWHMFLSLCVVQNPLVNLWLSLWEW